MKLNRFANSIKDLFDFHAELDVEAASTNIRKNINFGGMNVWILACAIVIASLGLNVNSTAVIIGAMLISPLMGPIIGTGLAVGTDDLQLLRSALKNLGIMVLISIIASTLFFVISPLNMHHPSELLARTNPTIYDVMIAFVGGVAGALETSRKEKGTVISGVAIATALMPPLCTVGYGISNLDVKISLGAFYLFFINCVFVALATFLVVKALDFPKVSHIDSSIEKRARRLASCFVVLLVVPSVLSAIKVVRENNFSTTVDRFVTSLKNPANEFVVYDYKTDTQERPYSLTLFMAGKKMSDTEKETLYSSAEKEYGISRHQILFEMALTAQDPSELEKQVYSDLTSNVETLRQQLQVYKASELPHDQIGAEVKALFPQVQNISLARGNTNIFAIVKCERDSTMCENLARWLKIRLDDEKVEMVIIDQQ